ncbi:Tocopherol chloroplastic [Micractinium conductrix]|uniref:Tocopherol chloroplastic n=1 Tax=Micractinium conductrix TaxID=554055 RepID=A0A2P6VEZ9_9CHLO|nr:Tocopherol chloroplastic [Micractinium conductrix]|eukprot:PSC72651.1 Tocopherol chloroplastic [Micractinium conductrix]
MGDLGQQLLSAASSGDLLALQACLEAGAGPSARSALLTAPLHAAALNGHAGCVTALLAAGADANARTGDSYTPLHRAACHGCTACVVALLAAGASPSAGDRSLFTPVHLAAFYDQPPVLRQLLAADSAAALLRNRVGHTPLQLALKKACINAARCLLQLASQQPTDELLAAIEMMPRWWAVWAVTAPPLYTLVAASQPLTPAQWERVPTPCPGLGTALPAVLERSASEAALLSLQQLRPGQAPPPALQPRLAAQAQPLQPTGRPVGGFQRSSRSRTSRQVAPQASARVPHSGYHFDGTPRRFFEGWYFRVTLPGDGASFALIYSIEDPAGGGRCAGVGAQVMGPDDGYLLQYSPQVQQFWADRSDLALGAMFRPRGSGTSSSTPPAGLKRLLPAAQFDAGVEEGFQASTTWHQGSIVRQEEGAGGDLPSTVDSCRWAFSVKPVVGWGDVGAPQKATAGWLAALPVFEPHWQVVMAHGLASGWIEWGGQRYEFTDAPHYVEKNWGGGFPRRWCWVQCNSFAGEAGTSVTAVGALRGLLGVPGVEENVGMIGIHHRGKFYEFLPNIGAITWDVDPWGRWRITARNGEHEAVVEATCEFPGTPLRAPTIDQGLTPFCRDSFCGQARIRVWRAGQTAGPPLVDCTSDGRSAAVEVGGGPWFSRWEQEAEMAAPVKALLNLPLDVEALAGWLPGPLRPPGL